VTVRLPIRWKLILLLGALSLAPLLLLAWNDVKTLAMLGSRLASQTGLALSEQARDSLERQADDFARLISLERKALEMIVHLQAREMTHRLQRAEPAGIDLLWPQDFPEEQLFPGAVTVADKYFQQLSFRRRIPIPVTFDRLSLYTAPGVDRKAILGDAKRLAGGVNFLRAVHPHYTDLVYWHFTALENGVHATFPGHGGFPASYDPRLRPWYRAREATTTLSWSRPQTDAMTRLTMISATLPLVNANGQFIGVTGIDVPVTRLLRAVHPAAPLAPYSQVLLTTPDSTSAASGRIEIIARQNHVDQGGDWREKFRTEYFMADDAAVAAELLADMQAGENGLKRLRYRGEDMFCVYRRFDAHSTYLVFLVPTAAAAKPAATAARYALETTRRQVDSLVPWIVIVAMATVTAALLGARAVTGPIHQLSAAVRAVAEGDFSVRVKIRSGDELEQLGAHFNQMIPQMAAHAQMKQALAIAREIQQRLLPSASPLTASLDIHGICLYAEETGGDYYDYLGDTASVDGVPKVLGVAIGDVSGHGVGSALLMTTARAFLNANDFEAANLADELRKLNVNLADDVHAGRFMTLCLLVFNLHERSVQWASAGHGPVLCYDHASASFIELAGRDIPLGIDPHWAFNAPGLRPISAGDVYVLTTDGVWETRAPDGTRFGKERLRACVAQHLGDDARILVRAIVDAVNAFRGDQPPQDDLTVVAIRVRHELATEV